MDETQTEEQVSSTSDDAFHHKATEADSKEVSSERNEINEVQSSESNDNVSSLTNNVSDSGNVRCTEQGDRNESPDSVAENCGLPDLIDNSKVESSCGNTSINTYAEQNSVDNETSSAPHDFDHNMSASAQPDSVCHETASAPLDSVYHESASVPPDHVTHDTVPEPTDSDCHESAMAQSDRIYNEAVPEPPDSVFHESALAPPDPVYHNTATEPPASVCHESALAPPDTVYHERGSEPPNTESHESSSAPPDPVYHEAALTTPDSISRETVSAPAEYASNNDTRADTTSATTDTEIRCTNASTDIGDVQPDMSHCSSSVVFDDKEENNKSLSELESSTEFDVKQLVENKAPSNSTGLTWDKLRFSDTPGVEKGSAETTTEIVTEVGRINIPSVADFEDIADSDSENTDAIKHSSVQQAISVASNLNIDSFTGEPDENKVLPTEQTSHVANEAETPSQPSEAKEMSEEKEISAPQDKNEEETCQVLPEGVRKEPTISDNEDGMQTDQEHPEPIDKDDESKEVLDTISKSKNNEEGSVEQNHESKEDQSQDATIEKDSEIPEQKKDQLNDETKTETPSDEKPMDVLEEIGTIREAKIDQVKPDPDEDFTPRTLRSRRKARLKFCKCCGNEFKTQEELDWHVVIHLEKASPLCVFRCPSCCHCYPTHTALKSHIDNVHYIDSAVMCMICDQPFRNRSELEVHLSTHNCGPDDLLDNGADSDATIEDGRPEEDSDSGRGELIDDPAQIMQSLSLPCKEEPLDSFGDETIADDATFNPKKYSPKACKGKGKLKYRCKHCGKGYRSLACLRTHQNKCTDEKPKFKCSQCGKAFRDQHNCRRHELMHQGIRPHKCTMCDKAYTKKSHLTVHMQTHTGDKPFPCTMCERSFSDSHNLKRHMMRHTGEKPFQCASCDKQFASRSDLNMHEKYHLSERPYKCDFPDCGKSYVKKSHLDQHSRVHSEEKQFQCEYCDKAYHSAQACKRHEMTHTGEKPYQCSYCDKAFTESSERKYHEIAQHDGQRPHTCMVCDKTFVRKGHLNTHMLTHRGERNFKCETCSKAFTTMYGLKKHRLIHTSERTLACEYCGKMFREPRNLKVHQMTHTGEKPHACQDCDKRFITSGELKMHMRVHTGEKPNTCEYCGMVFSQKGNLARHLLRHTGERPLKCEVCGKGFIEKQELNAHLLNHNGLKPFKCEHCGLGFTRKHHLKKHYRTHTGVKPHACEFCGKTFSERYNLQTHRVIHTGVKPHPCPFCSQGFIRRGHLVKHCKEAHPEQELDDSPRFFTERHAKPNPATVPPQAATVAPTLPPEPKPEDSKPVAPPVTSQQDHQDSNSMQQPGNEIRETHSSDHYVPQAAINAIAPSRVSHEEHENSRDLPPEANNHHGGQFQDGNGHFRSRPPYLPAEVDFAAAAAHANHHGYPLHPQLMQQYMQATAGGNNMAANMLPMSQEGLLNHMNRLSEMHQGTFPNPNMFPL